MKSEKKWHWYDEILPILATAFNCAYLLMALLWKENYISDAGKAYAAILIVFDYILIRICFSKGEKDVQALMGIKYMGQLGLLFVMDFSEIAAVWINIVCMTITNAVYIIYMVTHKDKD